MAGIQTIPREDFGGSLGQALAGGFQQGFQGGLERQYAQAQKQQKASSLQSALTKAQATYDDTTLSPEQKLVRLYKDLPDHPEVAQAIGQQMAATTKASQPKAPKQPPLSERQVPAEVTQGIQQIVDANPAASADELLLKMDQAGIPRAYSNQFSENRRRSQDATTKANAKLTSERSKETLPYRTEVAEKAGAARTGIENKERLMELIDTGNLDDPTFAAISEALPLNLGKRLLSPETVEYKAGLIEEFGDLRRLFQGQTRVKEIELLEQKIADLYLTDEQKKRILKSRVGALQADVLKADVTAEVERDLPNAGIGQFTKEVERRYKMALKEVADTTIDEQKSIIKEAEEQRKKPLSSADPNDAQILRQILKEADDDLEKAREIAKKKGYRF